MDDVYQMKFKDSNNKKRPYPQEFDQKTKKGLTMKDRSLKSGGDDLKTSTSHLSYRSKSFKDGEEVLSEDSYLFQWKPDYIQKNEKYWDKKMHNFACAKGSSGLAYKNQGPKDHKEDVDMQD